MSSNKHSHSAPRGQESYGLRAQALSPLEVLGQSIANIAPTATPTVVIPLVFAVAGNATWAAYIFAVIGMLLVSANINAFARRSASPGSLYTYIVEGLGPSWGITIGWTLFVAYVTCASAVTTGYTNYVNVLLKDVFALEGDISPYFSVGILGLGVIAAWFVAYKDIRLSARLILGIEFISVSFIILIVAITLYQGGLKLDWAQFKFEGVTFEGLRIGLVLAIFSFVGFESATALGSEAQKPLKTVPAAVRRSVILVGLLFAISAYAQVLGFEGSAVTLDKSDAPLQVLSVKAGVPLLGKIITVGAIISFFACVLASITAGARILFLMGRHGLFTKAIGQAHEKNQTPHIATTISAIIAFVPAAILTAAGANLFAIYGWIGTTTTLAFIVAYVAISVAAPLYLKRRKALTPFAIFTSIASVALLVMVLAGLVYPLPEAPYSYPIYAFVGLFIAGGLLSLFVKFNSNSKNVRENIARDISEINERFSDAGRDI